MNMQYTNVLSNFSIELDTYEDLKKEDDTDVSVINDKDDDRKVIKWVSIFTECLSLEPMDPEELWFMYSEYQMLFQVRWIIP